MATRRKKKAPAAPVAPEVPQAAPENAPAVEGTVELKRVFLYGAQKLDDPGSDKTPEECKDYFAVHFPELLNADIKGPVPTDTEIQYKFVARVAPKG